MDDRTDPAPGMANRVGQLRQGCDNDGEKENLFHRYTQILTVPCSISKSHYPEDHLAE